ncbi:MAG: hypothetical protein RPR91_09630, partial [Colwellia sp.]
MRLSFVNCTWLLPIIVTVVLTACDSHSNRYVTNYPLDSIVQLDEVQNVNQSIDLLLHFPFDTVSQINWQQTAGEPVLILAKTSKVISFTPTLAGDYSFSVSFILNDGFEQTLIKSVTVNNDYHKLTSRLSHAALAGSKVSLRSQLHETINIDTLAWQQIEGPNVTLTTESSDSELVIFFDAPQVDVDTIVTFEVSATDPDSNTLYRDQVAVLIEPAATIGNNAYFSDRKASVFTYNSNSPYAEDLVTCIYANTLTSSCTLAQTP